MSTLLRKVKARLFLTSPRRSAHPLEGAHAAVLRGRSLDFDDLRVYQPGDEVRDIDWRASARSNQVLIKRYIATRRQVVSLTLDTGVTMDARATDGTRKRDLALLIAGVLGYLSLRHGDEVGTRFATETGLHRQRGATSEGRLELALRGARDRVAGAEFTRERLLDSIVREERGRRILTIITDETPIGDAEERQLRRLRVQHDLVWITVCEAPLLETARDTPVDVQTGWAVPTFARSDTALIEELARADAAERERRIALLNALSITNQEIRTEAEVVPTLLDMLRRKHRARR
ncbi:DUF58 domain-containing protein [Mycetocola saprophilus]|uniref:DUF58 domain-containing protein n=1 Tax=Mycetocola saprophilus TaxID=76636 RepID=UPI0004C0AA98|nr:DUF58 domain-containing protein [Mycetocola saprophilus]